MEDNRAWDVGASATAIGQEVRKNSKNVDKPIQGFLFLGTLRTQGGGGATQLHSFQPGGFSPLVHSLYESLTFAGGCRDRGGRGDREGAGLKGG